MKDVRQTSITLGALLVFWLIIGAYFYVFKKESGGKDAEMESFASAIQSTQSVSRNAPAGWRVHENARYGFSLFYPEGMAVKEFDEGGGASTITFEDTKNGLGFQIFVVPYAEPQVSEKRFRKDNPSGVRENLENVVVDGATGAAFVGKHPFLGETREVWFIRKGYLYEVTTFKGLGDWFVPIMQTWRFIE